MKKEFRFDADEVRVARASRHGVDLEFEADVFDVLSNIDAKSAVAHFDVNELLDEMDEDEIKAYLGITEQQD